LDGRMTLCIYVVEENKEMKEKTRRKVNFV
jgi:hypothetical protein